jgi:hypothetical protein
MRNSAPGVRVFARLAALLSCALPAGAQTRWHVDAGAPPGGDGLSWATAFQSPDDGLALALVRDEVWVKAGTYTTATPVDPLDQRAGLFDQTILTGELGIPGDPTDNAYRVVSAIHPSGIPPGATTIDGFTIRDGYGVGTPLYQQGGGVFMFNSGLRLFHCTIRDNTARWGAGLHGQPAAVALRWCKFFDNHALERGGAIWGQAISYRIPHCEFHGNSAQRGGAIYLGGGTYASGKMTLSSSTITYNRATIGGGGIWASTDTGFNAWLPVDFNDVDEDGNTHELVPVDLDGERRIQDDPAAAPFGGVVDMGAYER